MYRNKVAFYIIFPYTLNIKTYIYLQITRFFFSFYAINYNKYLYTIKHAKVEKLIMPINFQIPNDQKITSLLGETLCKIFFKDIYVVQTR